MSVIKKTMEIKNFLFELALLIKKYEATKKLLNERKIT